ncbi:MAG TPA: formyltransferase [Candidatus Binatia bacterium]|nr:formyltransferase [Candidatus Binatia bacterium]
MKLAVFAYQDVGYECLDFLIHAGADIHAVVTHEDDPREEIWFRSVADLARRRHLPVYAPENPNTVDFIETIRRAAPELIFSFYYRRILSKDLLSIPRLGALNLHGSLLPRYRGRAPVNWAIVNGESETGVTLHYMVERADAGDIVAQKRVPIDFDDTALALYRKLTRAARELMAEIYPLLIEGRAPRTAQDHGRATKFGGRRPEDGRIDWRRPAVEIYNLVRGVTHPYPGAFTFLRGKKLFVWKADVDRQEGAADAGAVLSIDDTGIRVAASAGAVVLQHLQFEGDVELPATAFAKNYRLSSGEVLGER